MFERDGELAVLGEAVADCARGNGRAIVVSGPPGSGKTALLEAFGRLAAGTGAMVLSAAASPAEREQPLAVLDHLLRNARVAPADVERVTALIASGVHEDSAETDAQSCGEWKVWLWKAMRHLAADQPIVIVIDDAHHGDTPSLQWLLYFVRRIRLAPVMVVFAESRGPWPRPPAVREELLREPHCTVLELGLLSPAGVRDLVAAELGPDADWPEAEWMRMTGGNPLLVRALARDHLIGDGREFARAVASCLARGGETMRDVARACAVLGRGVSHGVAANVAGLPASVVREAMAALADVGLFRSGRFRHEAIRRAVLDDMPADLSARLHGTAAELLHDEGASPAVIAEHLVGGADLDRPWVSGVLCAAGEQALGDGQPARAARYLRHARRRCTGERDRASITSTLARAEWQVDPTAVTRYLAELIDAARRGLLTGRQAMEPITYLLWHGRTDEAADLVRVVVDPAVLPLHDSSSPLWMCCVYIELLMLAPPEETAAGAPALPGQCDDAEQIVVWAEHVLQGFRLDSASVAPVAAALGALVHSGRLDRADRWCTEVLAAAEQRGIPTWQAFLAAVRAMIRLRAGDLVAARADAEHAVRAVEPRSWGAAVGLPLGAALTVATEQGDYDRGARVLGVPVPKAMFRTPFALLYLRARGKYHLATGELHAALGDFQACGRLMETWGLDVPSLIPWRTDAAEAYLRLGKKAAAQELVVDQVDRLSGPANERGLPGTYSDDLRTRAITMRAVAAVEDDPAKRPAILRRAVDILSNCGDKLELANAFAELSEAHAALGEHAQAQMMARRAVRLAKECGAERLVRSLGMDPDAEQETPQRERLARLSFAERKVVLLAAEGYTNRQIATTLHVTVSTVEQHLTRSYRKLGLSKRSDLAAFESR